MPIWGDILTEIAGEQQRNNPNAVDHVRRRYLAQLYAKTQRETILYATAFTQKPGSEPGVLSIADEDIQGIMNVIHGLKGPKLDLILHSPGGSIEAAEALVRYLRSKFTHIRVIVPVQAMSAATMISCAADRIVMGKHSFLGPIDPQLVLHTALGARMVAADAIIDQFDRAVTECQDPKKLMAWAPMLQQYGPDLLQHCENVVALSRTLVTEWLQTYMFKRRPDRVEKAAKISEWLAAHGNHKTHGRHLSREQLKEQGLCIDNLEKDQELQDLVLSIFHATTLTFTMSAAAKIIENHSGRAFVKQLMPIAVLNPTVPPGIQ